MSKKKYFVSFILVSFIACMLIFALAACGQKTPPADEKTAEKLEVTTMPSKTEYYTGEEISLDGGRVTVYYDDNSSEVLELADSRLEVNTADINMSTAGQKTITVRYGGARTTFKITVKIEGLSVTFDYNYDGAEDVIEPVNKGTKVSEPETPERPARGDGTEYTFEGWYTDETMTYLYDFDTPVNESIVLYALWIAGDSVELTLDFNYDGTDSLDMKMQSGEAPRAPAVPVRDKFVFEGWYADAACTETFDFTKPLDSDKTIYAKWTRSETGTDTYVFEAEHIDLSQKSGPGYSGTAAGKDMIVTDPNASNMQYVGFLYKQDIVLDFHIDFSERAEDVTLVVRMSADIPEVTEIDSELYGVRVNGTFVDYAGPVRLECVADGTPGEWVDVTIGTNMTFEKGDNTIELVTLNNKQPSAGSTYAAIAPVIDCIKLTTAEVPIWDGTRGLPWKP